MRTAVEELYMALSSQFGGDLLRPQDQGFSEARRIWNSMVSSTPGLIARCACVEDVQAAVLAANSLGVLTAVRCGGHSLAGFGSCHGGLVIDLCRMRQVSVDETKRCARFAGGCLLGNID